MKKLKLLPASGLACCDPEVELVIDKIGFGTCLLLCDPQTMAFGVAHPLFHDSSQFASTSILNPMAYADLVVDGLIDRLKHTHESFETLEKGAFAPRLGAVLIGGCIPLIERYDEESTPELLAISLRTTQTIKRSLQASEIPLRYEQTGGQHRCSIHIRGSRVTIGQERGLREPLISEISIHHPKWQLSQEGQTQPLT